MGTLFKPKFKVKLLSFFTAYAVAIFLIALAIFVYFRRLEDTHAKLVIAHELNERTLLATSHGQKFLLNDLENLSFYENAASDHLSAHKNELMEINGLLAKLKERRYKSRFLSADYVIPMEKVLNDYDLFFNAFHKNIRRVGFGRFGMVGKLDSLRNIMLGENRNAWELVQELEELENDYLNSRNLDVIINIKKKCYDFSNMGMYQTPSNEFERAISDYLLVFDDLVEVDLGNRKEDSNSLHQYIRKTEDTFYQLSKTLENRYVETIQELITKIQYLVMVGVTLSVTVALFFGISFKHIPK